MVPKKWRLFVVETCWNHVLTIPSICGGLQQWWSLPTVFFSVTVTEESMSTSPCPRTQSPSLGHRWIPMMPRRWPSNCATASLSPRMGAADDWADAVSVFTQHLTWIPGDWWIEIEVYSLDQFTSLDQSTNLLVKCLLRDSGNLLHLTNSCSGVAKSHLLKGGQQELCPLRKNDCYGPT